MSKQRQDQGNGHPADSHGDGRDDLAPMNHPYRQRPGKPGRIGYIRKDIPDFEAPEYKGERYRALVPDTLDLQDMAAWGVNGLTSSNNPDVDYEAYWGAEFGSNPLRMANGMDGGRCQVKYLESLPLLRIASGSTQNQMVDRRWMEVLLHMQAKDLSMRIPEWVKPEDVDVEVDSCARTLSWDGRYAVVGDVKPGAVVTMRFPIPERIEKVWIEKKQYTLIIKGNDVVAIDPPGEACPLYQRAHYRLNRTRWKETERFAPEAEKDRSLGVLSRAYRKRRNDRRADPSSLAYSLDRPWI